MLAFFFTGLWEGSRLSILGADSRGFDSLQVHQLIYTPPSALTDSGENPSMDEARAQTLTDCRASSAQSQGVRYDL